MDALGRRNSVIGDVADRDKAASAPQEVRDKANSNGQSGPPSPVMRPRANQVLIEAAYSSNAMSKADLAGRLLLSSRVDTPLPPALAVAGRQLEHDALAHPALLPERLPPTPSQGAAVVVLTEKQPEKHAEPITDAKLLDMLKGPEKLKAAAGEAPVSELLASHVFNLDIMTLDNLLVLLQALPGVPGKPAADHLENVHLQLVDRTNNADVGGLIAVAKAIRRTPGRRAADLKDKAWNRAPLALLPATVAALQQIIEFKKPVAAIQMVEKARELQSALLGMGMLTKEHAGYYGQPGLHNLLVRALKGPGLSILESQATSVFAGKSGELKPGGKVKIKRDSNDLNDMVTSKNDDPDTIDLKLFYQAFSEVMPNPYLKR